MLKFIKIALIIALVAYFGVKAYFYFNAKTSGEIAPEINATLIDGSAFKLSDLKNDYVLLYFWGSWCGPCRSDAPKLVALNHKYTEASFKDADKFHTVSISLEKYRGDAWKNFAMKTGFNWHHQIVERHKLVMMSPIAQSYGVTDIPAKFLVSPDGTIQVVNNFGEIDGFLAGKIR